MPNKITIETKIREIFKGQQITKEAIKTIDDITLKNIKLLYKIAKGFDGRVTSEFVTVHLPEIEFEYDFMSEEDSL